MSDDFSIVGLSVALILPWAMGSLLVYRLFQAESCRNLPLIVGHGYMVGLFTTGLLVRGAASILGAPSFWSVAGLMSLVILGLLFMVVQNRTAQADAEGAGPGSTTWQWVLIMLLLGLSGLRLWALAQELVLRPLFPWDAWMNWAPKAVVWFGRGELVEFVSPPDWLAAADRSTVYTLGNWRAAQYPEGLPLVSLWTMMGAQTSVHSLLNLPWLCTLVALASAFLGHLRLAGAPLWLASMAVYFLISMPYVDVHTVLAGYADLWLTAAFTLSVLCLHAGGLTGQRRYTLIAVVLALFCTQLKVPGLALAAVTLTFAALQLLGLQARYQLLALVFLASIAAAAIVVGVELSVPGLGDLLLSTDAIQLPLLGRLELGWHPVHSVILKTLFAMINWHLLWYLYAFVMGAFLIGCIRGPGPADHQAGVVLATLTAVFIITLVFVVTPYYQQALDLKTVNRAYLYVAPLALYTVFLIVNEGIISSGPRTAVRTVESVSRPAQTG